MVELFYTLLFVTAPAALLWLIKRQGWARKLGSIILCYSLGLLLGNSGVIPESVASIQTTLTDVCVALALPMLLFTLNIRAWLSVASKAVLSLVLATSSVVFVASTLYFFYAETNSIEASHLAAMSVGVYTGGTANLAAIKSGLGIANDLYVLFHSLDTVLGAAYLMFMMSVAIPLFRKLLPSAEPPLSAEVEDKHGSANNVYNEDYAPLLSASNAQQLAKIMALAVICLAGSLGLSELAEALFNLQSTSAVTILLLTSFGILFSLSPKVRALELAYKLGMYLILVFCVVVASMANLSKLAELNMTVALFLFGTMVGSLVLHALFCRLTKVDGDTFMVTSVSAICSPPFVPMMAKALNNPQVLLSGMTTGIIGFAVGNYLGISLALLLQSMN